MVEPVEKRWHFGRIPTYEVVAEMRYCTELFLEELGVRQVFLPEFSVISSKLLHKLPRAQGNHVVIDEVGFTISTVLEHSFQQGSE